MVKVVVNLNDIEKLKSFVNVVSTFEADFDAVRGRYIIDAKSIMGMMSLNLSKPLDIVMHDHDNEKEVARFLEVAKNYQ